MNAAPFRANGLPQWCTGGMTTNSGSTGGFSAEEKAAMKERAAETRREAKNAKGAKTKEADAQACADKIASMAPADRAIAEKVHAIVAESAPHLSPKTWYGMPAYARDGKVLCFFQAASKFDTRYSTLGFNDIAALDDGNVWPSAYAITKLTAADKKKLGELIAKAAG